PRDAARQAQDPGDGPVDDLRRGHPPLELPVEGPRARRETRGPSDRRARRGTPAFPGSGATVAIAARRTTFCAAFRNIDSLKKGDTITLTMPYGTFTYRVRANKVVKSNDWRTIKGGG